MFSPPASIGEIDGASFSSHTRCLNRKALSKSAPTGHKSTTFPDSLLSSGLPGKIEISSLLPLPSTNSSDVPETSRVNRTHRVHMMQRSLYSSTFSPTSFFGFLTLSSSKRDWLRPYSYE